MVEELPRQILSWNDLAVEREIKQDWTGEHKALEKAISINPKDPTALYNLARSNRRLGFRDVAVRQYKELNKLSSDPDMVKDAQEALSEIEAEKRHLK